MRLPIQVINNQAFIKPSRKLILFRCYLCRSKAAGRNRPLARLIFNRCDARSDTRAGHYRRKLHTKAGEVTLQVPKLRQQTFETAIIERYRRRLVLGIGDRKK